MILSIAHQLLRRKENSQGKHVQMMLCFRRLSPVLGLSLP